MRRLAHTHADTAVFMWVRLLDGSYAPGGKFFGLLAESAKPAFAAHTAARPLLNGNLFVLLSMLATAFLAHFNAPKFYRELPTPTDGSTKQSAFRKLCIGAFSLSAVISAAIMSGGFLTFGGAAKGLILNSYATADPLAFLARLGICASIIFSYPLIFVALRDATQELLGIDGSKKSVHVGSTLLLLSAVNGVALVLKDLGLVVSVGGAALGSSLVYTFPALMFVQATRQKAKALKAKGEELPAGRKREMLLNVVMAALGVSLSVLGVRTSLAAAK